MVIYNICLSVFMIFSVLLIFLIVMQDWKSAHLGSGLGLNITSTPAMFGTDLPAVVKKTTGWMICFFLLGALGFSFWTVRLEQDPNVDSYSAKQYNKLESTD